MQWGWVKTETFEKSDIKSVTCVQIGPSSNQCADHLETSTYQYQNFEFKNSKFRVCKQMNIVLFNLLALTGLPISVFRFEAFVFIFNMNFVIGSAVKFLFVRGASSRAFACISSALLSLPMSPSDAASIFINFLSQPFPE